jgi:cell division transport system permease protein
MKTWLRQHLAAFSRALQRLWNAPLNTLLSLLVIGIAMTLPAAGYVFLDNIRTLGANITGAQQLSLFMQTDASPETLGNAQARLEQILPGQWRFISREEALEHLESSEGMAEIVASLPHNPLPDTFIIEPRQVGPEALGALSKNLAALPGVAHVQLDFAWVKRFDAFLQLGKLIVSLLAAVFAVGLIAVTFNTIRLQVLARADEIEVARLVGATDAFIRRPFYYIGVIQGALGGLVAVFLITVGLSALNPPVTQLSALYGSDFSLRGLAVFHSFLLPVISAALGWLGAQLSVSMAIRQIGRK